jgi:ATPase subunit of ABC transporter with duplicated ATPase domains
MDDVAALSADEVRRPRALLRFAPSAALTHPTHPQVPARMSFVTNPAHDEDNFDSVSLDSSASKAKRELKVDISFKNLGVELVDGKKILQGVTGCLKAGRMTAIMGPSGCGKSTFLSALTNRIRDGGKVVGDVRINGERRYVDVCDPRGHGGCDWQSERAERAQRRRVCLRRKRAASATEARPSAAEAGCFGPSGRGETPRTPPTPSARPHMLPQPPCDRS